MRKELYYLNRFGHYGENAEESHHSQNSEYEFMVLLNRVKSYLFFGTCLL